MSDTPKHTHKMRSVRCANQWRPVPGCPACEAITATLDDMRRELERRATLAARHETPPRG